MITIEHFMDILNDRFLLVVKKHVLYFHLFNVVLEKYVLDDLLLALVLFLELLSFLTHDLLLLKLSFVASLPCLRQASRIEKYAMHNVERVSEPVTANPKKSASSWREYRS